MGRDSSSTRSHIARSCLEPSRAINDLQTLAPRSGNPQWEIPNDVLGYTEQHCSDESSRALSRRVQYGPPRRAKRVESKLRITLRQLRVFETVARTGSIAKASIELVMSPPAISMSLKELEGHLQRPVFDRQGRRLILNESGREIREMAHSLLLQAQELEESVSDRRVRGRLRIGAPPPLAIEVLPQLCAAFMVRHPHALLDVTIASSLEIMSATQKMAIGVGIVGSPVNSNYLSAEPWFADDLVVCCAPDNPLRDQVIRSIAELRDQPWILDKALSGERTSFVMQIFPEVPELRVALEANSLELIKETVRRTDALACLSRISVARELASGTLAELPIVHLRIRHAYNLITRRDVYLSRAQQAFLEIARDLPGSLGLTV